MTAALAEDYIRLRMEELGQGDYHIRLRHFVLAPQETRQIAAGLQLFVLAEAAEGVRIQSEMGLFDLSETAVNELQYEHQGNIQLVNYSSVARHVPMLQVIFK